MQESCSISRRRAFIRATLRACCRRSIWRLDAGDDSYVYAQAGAGVERGGPGEYAVRDSAQGRGTGQGLRHRGESTGFANRALCLEGDGSAVGQDCVAADDWAYVAGVDAGAGCRAHGSGYGQSLLREVAGLSVEQVSRRRYGAGAGDEVDRRGDGRGGQFWRGVCQGADFGRAGAAAEGNGLLQRERPRQGRGCGLARQYVELGFHIVATQGTAECWSRPA